MRRLKLAEQSNQVSFVALRKFGLYRNAGGLERLGVLGNFVLPLTYPEKGGRPSKVSFIFLLPVPYVVLLYSPGDISS
jgi:hypothetical protein